jgi:Fe-S cluster biosynthesis and repair protein YggX
MATRVSAKAEVVALTLVGSVEFALSAHLSLIPNQVCNNRKKFQSEGFAMSGGHTVFCVRLQKQLPGLDEPPFDTELGQKVYENVSKEAWNMWMEHCKMLLNEYRLNPARKEDQQVIVNQLEQFFFGEGAAPPKEYVPPSK